MGKQHKTGKAFEYALLIEIAERLSEKTNVIIIENSPYITAQKFFSVFSDDEKDSFRLTASFAINFIINLEPRLSREVSEDDKLEVEIVSDSRGQSGDVRDILMIRSMQNWEIGISAKNKHRAVKHSRLSQTIDFGSEWMEISCSKEYFKEIRTAFSTLSEIHTNNKKAKWEVIGDKHQNVYVPVLKAFKKELLRLYDNQPNVVPKRLTKYLIGNRDYYKVIRGDSKVELQAFNLNGTLNKPFKSNKPKAKIRKIKLPTRLIDITFKKKLKTTLIVTLNEGWQFTFRIHNANKFVEPSLKFDINLVSHPYTLFANHLITNEK